MKRQDVVKIEPAGVTMKNESTWKITLSCGYVMYRTRKKKRGKKIHPPPVWVYCFCPKCSPRMHPPTVECFGYEDEYDHDTCYPGDK